MTSTSQRWHQCQIVVEARWYVAYIFETCCHQQDVPCVRASDEKNEGITKWSSLARRTHENWSVHLSHMGCRKLVSVLVSDIAKPLISKTPFPSPTLPPSQCRRAHRGLGGPALCEQTPVGKIQCIRLCSFGWWTLIWTFFPCVVSMPGTVRLIFGLIQCAEACSLPSSLPPNGVHDCQLLQYLSTFYVSFLCPVQLGLYLGLISAQETRASIDNLKCTKACSLPPSPWCSRLNS